MKLSHIICILPFRFLSKHAFCTVGLWVALVLQAAAQIAAWDFTDENTAAATSSAELFDEKLDSANTVTRGSSATASGANHSFRSSGFKDDAISTANTDFFQISLSAAAGCNLSISTLDANFNGTASFCVAPGVTGQFAYSLDGNTFALLANPFIMTAPGAMPQIDLASIAALQNVPDSTTVTLRYYASGQTKTGTWGFSSAAAGQFGLAVGGTLAASNLPSLTLSATPSSFAENTIGTASIGTVTIPTVLASDLLVTLISGDLTEVSVPATVTINAGSNSASFPITAVNDLLADGTQTFDLAASAPSFTSSSFTICVTDDGDTPPALAPGAVAFVGFNADGNDDLAIVALMPLAASDMIFITDRGWNGLSIGQGGAFADGEGVITWAVPVGGVPAGTVIAFNNLTNTSRSASLGTLTATGSFNLSGDGETVYAYQGTATVPTGFIAVIASQGTDPITGTGLNARHIVYLPNHADVAAYVGPRNDQTDFAAYLTLIATPTNWLTEDGSGDQHNNSIAPDVPFDTTAFSLANISGYAGWAATHANHQAADADADKDGVANGIEYFMGEAGREFTPQSSVANGKIRWPHDPTAVASYSVATSTDLVHWLSATEGVKDNGDSVEFTLPSGTPQVFVRLEVNLGP